MDLTAGAQYEQQKNLWEPSSPEKTYDDGPQLGLDGRYHDYQDNQFKANIPSVNIPPPTSQTNNR